MSALGLRTVTAVLRRLFTKKPPELEIDELGPGNLVVRAGGHEISASLPTLDLAPDSQDYEPLPPITLDNPACPYCGVIQDPPPKRRKKCRDCGERIHTWTDYETRVKYLLTAKQDEQRKRRERDERWAELNRQTLKAYRTGDFHSAQMAHFEKALILFDRGANHHQSAEAARKDELLYYQRSEDYRDMGVRDVVISTCAEASCAVCAPLEGQRFSIKDALRLMPIPHKDCKTLADQNQHGGWCRCSYEPVLEEEL